MIEAIRGWVTAIVVTTMLLSVMQMLIPDGNLRKISSFTGGMILLIVLTRPLLKLHAEQLDLQLDTYMNSIESCRAELAEEEQDQMEKLIAQTTAAYISDKAETLGVSVSVEVETERGEQGIPIPSAVTVWGPYSIELASYIEKELGIPAERQVWQ